MLKSTFRAQNQTIPRKGTLIRSGLFFILSFFAFNQAFVWGDENPDVQKIKEKKKLVVAMFKDDEPPFFWKKSDGTLAGYDVELVQKIAAALQVEAVMRRDAGTYDEVVEMVARGEADLGISFLSQTLHRQKKVTFSQPYLTVYLGVIMKEDSTPGSKGLGPAKPQEGKGIMGIEASTSHHELVRHLFPQYHLKSFKRWDEIFAALVRDEIQAAFTGELEMKKSLLDHPLEAETMKMTLQTNLREQISIAISPQYSHLDQWLNHFLDENKLHTTADELLRHYKVNQ